MKTLKWNLTFPRFCGANQQNMSHRLITCKPLFACSSLRMNLFFFLIFIAALQSHLYTCCWSVWHVYSTTRHFSRLSLRYPINSFELPGQLVSSNSSSCRSWMRFESPLDVSCEQPATERMCRFRMPQIC